MSKEESVKLDLGDDAEESEEESEEEEDLEDSDEEEQISPQIIAKKPTENLPDPAKDPIKLNSQAKPDKPAKKEEKKTNFQASGNFVFADYNKTIKTSGNKVCFGDKKTIFTKISENLYEKAMKGNQKLDKVQLDKLQNDYYLSREFEQRGKTNLNKKFKSFCERNSEFRESKKERLEEKKEEVEAELMATLEKINSQRNEDTREFDQFYQDQKKFQEKVKEKTEKTKTKVEKEGKKEAYFKPKVNKNSKSIAAQKTGEVVDYHERLFRETIGGSKGFENVNKAKTKKKSEAEIKKIADKLSKNHKEEAVKKVKAKLKKQQEKKKQFISSEQARTLLFGKAEEEIKEVVERVFSEGSKEEFITVLRELRMLSAFDGENQSKLAKEEEKLCDELFEEIEEDEVFTKAKLAGSILAILGLIQGGDEEEDPLLAGVFSRFEGEEEELSRAEVLSLHSKFSLLCNNRMLSTSKGKKQKVVEKHKKDVTLQFQSFQISEKSMMEAEKWRQRNSDKMKEYYKNQSLGDLGSDDDVPKSFFSPNGRLRVDLMYDIMKKRNDK